MTEMGEALLASLADEASRIEEDALYSSRGHFEAARGWNGWHLLIGSVATLAAAAAGVSVLRNQTVVSAILAFLAAASSGLLTFLNPKDRAAVHLKAGNLFKSLHNDSRLFRLIDCRQQRSIDELSKGLQDLNGRRNKLNGESPQIPRSAFLRARKGIEEGEARYKVDEQSLKQKLG